MIEYLPLVLTGLGLSASIIYYASILRNSNKTRELQLKSQQLAIETRQVQLFTRYIDTIWSKETQDSFNILNKPSYTNEEIIEIFNEDWEYNRAFYRWAYYWDTVGLLYKQGFFDIELIAASGAIASAVIMAWERHRDFIIKMRESGRFSKRHFDTWEHLYNDLMIYLEGHPELAT